MRENRPYGSEGGASQTNGTSLPLSLTTSLPKKGTPRIYGLPGLRIQNRMSENSVLQAFVFLSFNRSQSLVKWRQAPRTAYHSIRFMISVRACPRSSIDYYPQQPDQASKPWITSPCTSVNRKSRPAYL